jgi:hypothetical protein
MFRWLWVPRKAVQAGELVCTCHGLPRSELRTCTGHLTLGCVVVRVNKFCTAVMRTSALSQYRVCCGETFSPALVRTYMLTPSDYADGLLPLLVVASSYFSIVYGKGHACFSFFVKCFDPTRLQAGRCLFYFTSV